MIEPASTGAELWYRIGHDARIKNQLITHIDIVIDMTDTPDGVLRAREGIFARILPQYEFDDPITSLDTRLRYDPKLLSVMNQRAKRAKITLLRSVPEKPHPTLLTDLCATLTLATLFYANRIGRTTKPQIMALYQESAPDDKVRGLIRSWMQAYGWVGQLINLRSEMLTKEIPATQVLEPEVTS